MEKPVLTIDIGGMAVKYTVFKNNRQQFNVQSIPLRNANRTAVLMLIKRIYNEHHQGITGIALSAPGAMRRDGTIWGPSAISNFQNFNLQNAVAKTCGYAGPIVVINDANAAAYADYTTVPRKSTVVTIAVGTGIGGGVIVNGQLVASKNGLAGEVGLFLLGAPSNNLTTCSQTSGFYHLETRYQQATGRSKSGRAIFNLYDTGDYAATQVVERMYHGLARALFNIAVLLDPDYIFIGGGLANRSEAPIELLKVIENMQSKLKLRLPIAPIKNSAFKSHAQLYGAYYFFKDNAG